MPMVRLHAEPRRAAPGFTLVEVLVALAIVALTLAAGVRAAGSSTLMAERLERSVAARWCAENQLAALRLARVVPPIGEADFGCEQLGRSWAGRMRTQATPNPNFRRVDAQVLDEQGAAIVSVSTVVSR